MTFENHVAKFVILNCVEDYSGTYTCTANNPAGTAETSCILSVQGKYSLYLYINNN